MKTQHYENQPPDASGNPCRMHLGTGLANTLAYLCDGFRGWQLYGFVLAEDCHFSVTVDGVELVPVYGKEHSTEVQSDEMEKELAQIAEGKTSILLFYGTDNSSAMRRITPDEFNSIVLTRYKPQLDDLYYNS